MSIKVNGKYVALPLSIKGVKCGSNTVYLISGVTVSKLTSVSDKSATKKGQINFTMQKPSSVDYIVTVYTCGYPLVECSGTLVIGGRMLSLGNFEEVGTNSDGCPIYKLGEVTTKGTSPPTVSTSGGVHLYYQNVQ